MESNENFNSSLHDNIDGRQIPAENISQGNYNSEEMMRDTSSRYGLKDITKEQLTKRTKWKQCNMMFHDTLKVILKLPDSVSQEYSEGKEVIQDTSKNVFQNTWLDLDALNSLGNSCINSDGLFQRNMPHYSLRVNTP